MNYAFCLQLNRRLTTYECNERQKMFISYMKMDVRSMKQEECNYAHCGRCKIHNKEYVTPIFKILAMKLNKMLKFQQKVDFSIKDTLEIRKLSKIIHTSWIKNEETILPIKFNDLYPLVVKSKWKKLKFDLVKPMIDVPSHLENVLQKNDILKSFIYDIMTFHV